MRPCPAPGEFPILSLDEGSDSFRTVLSSMPVAAVYGILSAELRTRSSEADFQRAPSHIDARQRVMSTCLERGGGSAGDLEQGSSLAASSALLEP
jgi:hypothetical protein